MHSFLPKVCALHLVKVSFGEDLGVGLLFVSVLFMCPSIALALSLLLSSRALQPCIETSKAKQLPTRDRFQNFAKSKGISVGYSQTGPVLKEFTKSLLTVMI